MKLFTADISNHRKIITKNNFIFLLTLFIFFIQFILILTLSIKLYNRWDLSVWDFGFFAQALELISNWQFNPYSTYLNFSFLRDHLAVILVPLGWLSSLFGPQLLLFSQALGLAGSSFLIARVIDKKIIIQKLHPNLEWALRILLPMVLLLYPWTYWGAAFDFHPDSVGVFFVSLALWSHFNNKRQYIYWICLVLALFSKDGFVFLTVTIGIIFLFDKETKRRGIFTFLLGMIGIFITQFVIKTAAAGGENGEGLSHFIQMYGYLGGSPKEIIITCITNPSLPINMLKNHIIYFGSVLGPLGYVLLFSVWGGIPFFLLVVLMYGLSNVGFLFDARYYYLHIVSPFLFLGTGFSLLKLIKYSQKVKIKFIEYIPVLLVSALSLYWAFSWLPGLPSAKLLTPPESANAFREAVKLIPNNATVLKFNVHGAGYTSRQKEYLVGTNIKIPVNNEDAYALLSPFVGKNPLSPNEQINALITVLNQPKAEVLFHKAGVWLIKFHSLENNIDFKQPDNINYEYPSWVLPTNVGDQVLNGPNLSDWYTESKGKQGYIIYGPYQKFLPGNYNAKIDLSLDKTSDLHVNVEVWDTKNNRLLNRKELSGGDPTKQVSLDFVINNKDYSIFNPVQGPIGAKILQSPPSQDGNPVEIRVWTNGKGTTQVYRTSVKAN